MKNNLKIMDVTLRDGSYAIDFQFSCQDVKCICELLDTLEIPYIELGHGMGIGASSIKYGVSLNTDEEYLKAAKKSIKNSKIGMFCIPGIAKQSQMESLSEYGMDFIRIGTNIDDVRSSEKYIKKAKKLGMLVMANYMKSYTATPDSFAENVKMSEAYGADIIYIVDSAGCMMPEDIEKYYETIRKNSAIKLGFHGHNNLGMALANSLYAAKLGIEYIDCSLQGIGRSSGNTVTEYLAVCAAKSGFNLNIDYKKLIKEGHRLIAPYLSKQKEIEPIDTLCGILGFHSGYLKKIYDISALYKVDPMLLIEKYCKVDKINLDENKLIEIAVKTGDY